MPKSELHVPDIGTVYVTKKRGQRSLRMRVDTKGQVQISTPWLVAKSQIAHFVLSKKDWIQEQQSEAQDIPYNGMLFGKTLQLVIRQNSDQIRSKQDGKHVIVNFSGAYDPTDDTHLKKIQTTMLKALRTEGEKLLLPRLRELADMYDHEFASSSIKHVVGRWGSCDSNGHIVLSIFLSQLPIEYIDYVIIHELAHTKHMNHSPAFWQTVERDCPEYKQLRKEMKQLRPKIYDAKTFYA